MPFRPRRQRPIRTTGNVMTLEETKGKTYEDIASRFPEVIAAVDKLGATVRGAGPIDDKTSLLIQLAAAAAVGRARGLAAGLARSARHAGPARPFAMGRDLSGCHLLPGENLPYALAAHLHHRLSPDDGGDLLESRYLGEITGCSTATWMSPSAENQ